MKRARASLLFSRTRNYIGATVERKKLVLYWLVGSVIESDVESEALSHPWTGKHEEQ